MRVLMAGFVVILTASAVFAQQPPAPAAAAASRTMVSASDVTALIAKAKAERKDNQALLAQSMIQLAPYNVASSTAPPSPTRRYTKPKPSCSTSSTGRPRSSQAAS